MNDSLTHYVVLGMKWGVRRSQAQLDRAAGRTAEKQARKERKQDVKNRKRLSDKDLNEKLKRLEAEKKLRELTSTELERGNRVVNQILRSVGTKVATTLLTGAVLYGVRAILMQKFDLSALGDYMTPKPKNK